MSEKRCYGKTITANPQICYGVPRIASRRISAITILRQIAAHSDMATVAGVWCISKREVRAVVEYACKLIERDGVTRDEA